MSRPLDYARPHEPDPKRPRHPTPVLWLLLICVVAFFGAGVHGLLFIDVLGLAAAGMMIGSALFILITVFGFLSRPRPAYVAAAIMTFGALGGSTFALLLNHGNVERYEQTIRATRTRPSPGGVIYIDVQSDMGTALAGSQAARIICGATTGLAFCLLVYLIVQSFQRLSDPAPSREDCNT